MERKCNPFNIEAAKRGARVQTRDGRSVRIICFDKKPESKKLDKTIIALVEGGYVSEELKQYYENGKLFSGGENSELDLVMAPEMLTGWVNIYRTETGAVAGFVYNTRENAEEASANCDRVIIATAKIEWEE